VCRRDAECNFITRNTVVKVIMSYSNFGFIMTIKVFRVICVSRVIFLFLGAVGMFCGS
jgi:hypothetical protein